MRYEKVKSERCDASRESRRRCHWPHAKAARLGVARPSSEAAGGLGAGRADRRDACVALGRLAQELRLASDRFYLYRRSHRCPCAQEASLRPVEHARGALVPALHLRRGTVHGPAGTLAPHAPRGIVPRACRDDAAGRPSGPPGNEAHRQALGAMACMGITTVVLPVVSHYAASQALWSGAAIVATLLATHAWRSRGGTWRLVPAAIGVLAAPAI